MYKIVTRFLGESPIYSAWELLIGSEDEDEMNYIKDEHGSIYNLSDFMRSNNKWYDGYMNVTMDSQYVIKFNKNCDSVRIFYQYQIYIPEKVAKATSKSKG